MSKKFQLIAAMTANRGIGFAGKLPWKKFSKDMDWFRQSTTNKAVIMGRKTFESLRMKPLPNRFNLVVSQKKFKEYTSDEKFQEYDNLVFCQSLSEAIHQQIDVDNFYVIGGSNLYRESLLYPKLNYSDKNLLGYAQIASI